MREELRVQAEHRAQRALRRSAIFPLTTIDACDFDYPKQIDRDLVLRAASLEFIADKTNCVFVGPSGVGKTHLANAIGQLACLRGYRVKFTTAADLVNDLVAGAAKNTLQRRLAAWASYELLLCDELGYLSFDARGADSSTKCSTAGTTCVDNRDHKFAIQGVGKLFPSAAAASAIADRLVHRGILVRILGKSKRSNEEVE